MNKTKKNCILVLLSLFVLMMTEASVSANEDDEPGILDRVDTDPEESNENEIYDSPSIADEPNLISPKTDTDLGPLIIAPGEGIENADISSGDNNFTADLILVIGISGFAGLVAALIIFKK